MSPLAELVADAKSGFACGEDPPDGVFQFRMNNVTVEGRMDLTKMRRVPRSTRNLDAYMVEPGDVLFNATNSSALVGKTVYFPGYREPTVFSNHFIRLRPRSGAVDGRFLARWLNIQFSQGVFEGMCRQWVNQATVSRDALLGLRVPHPFLVEEQRRIAEVLDRAEALRAKRRAALALLDTLTQSIFLDLFGDPAAMGWPMTTLERLAATHENAIRTGPFGSQLLHSEFVDAGIRVLGIDNAVENEFSWGIPRFISESKYTQLQRYTVHPGDVLITIMGTCGRCAIVPDGIPTAINTKHLCCITLNRDLCLPEVLHAFFLQHSLARGYLDRRAKGAIMDGLNMGIIKAMPIPIAPIDLQQRFVRQVGAISKLKAAHRASLAQLDALFASLQHRAFRGEL